MNLLNKRLASPITEDEFLSIPFPKDIWNAYIFAKNLDEVNAAVSAMAFFIQFSFKN